MPRRVPPGTLGGVDLFDAARWLLEDGPALLDARLVGLKFTRQVELARAGFPVPPLVCVPATVFDLAMAGMPAASPGSDPAERAAQLRRAPVERSTWEWGRRVGHPSLPLAGPLQGHFDQPVSWRSVQRVRLLTRLGRLTGFRPARDQFFAAPTAAAVFKLYAPTHSED
jgi:hypothetical protein